MVATRRQCCLQATKNRANGRLSAQVQQRRLEATKSKNRANVRLSAQVQQRRLEAAGLHNQSNAFLSIPRELRDMVYQYLLVRNGPLRFSKQPRNSKRWPLDPNTLLEIPQTACSAQDFTPSLLLVCRQTHEEVYKTIYSKNIFCFENSLSLTPFLSTLGKKELATLYMVEIEMHIYDPTKSIYKAWGSLLMEAVNLRYLRVHEKQWGPLASDARLRRDTIRTAMQSLL